ncbi:MAG: 7-carboxy-7-deazaguanine synthase QueE [Frankiaceae bacterium]|nr:7-carboxy-7-deazaguanine synthase QueE [Frankiaceae bacterium]MBV9869363.1 7-carboxy-7-deazaguanine synthase QueE [Frankiaceae bacterium]
MDPWSSNADASLWRGVPRPLPGELLISEVFGPTLQGEGPSSGQPAAFVRLGMCNLACAWCDTAYTWDSTRFDLSHELRPRSTDDVANQVIAIGSRLVVVTGGEPALQSDGAASLAEVLRLAGRRIELETSGSVPLGALLTACDLIVVSPKLANGRMDRRARLRWDCLQQLAAEDHVVFKFVVQELAELAEVQEIVDHLAITPGRVWIMPEATSASGLLAAMQLLALPVVQRGWALSSRLQVLLWDGTRGR